MSEKNHAAKCKVCNSDRCKEFNDRYLAGERPVELSIDMNLELDSIYRHVRYLELDKKRDNSTLAIINRLTDTIQWSKLKIETVRNALTVLDLRAKLLGEIVQKHEHKEILDELTTEQLQELARDSTELVDARLSSPTGQDGQEAQTPS